MSFDLTYLIPALTIGLALVLDIVLGEPKRYHPLVGFGNLAIYAERKLNRTPSDVPGTPTSRYFTGILAWALLILPITLLIMFLVHQITMLGVVISLITNTFILYLCIGWKSLIQHVKAIQSALENNDTALARQRTQMIVSRDTDELDEQQISQTAIESLLENGNDAIFGCLFWFVVAGAPGAVLYRMANTLDAMWGYRTERFNEFGWGAAKLDDLLNVIPARLCALSYALLSNTRRALACWNSHAHLLASPNGGPVMTSGAGGLQIILGGPTKYHGSMVDKPFFGEGNLPSKNDISRAIRLVNNTVYLWLVVTIGFGLTLSMLMEFVFS